MVAAPYFAAMEKLSENIPVILVKTLRLYPHGLLALAYDNLAPEHLGTPDLWSLIHQIE